MTQKEFDNAKFVKCAQRFLVEFECNVLDGSLLFS